MALSSHKVGLIRDDSLQNWQVIGSGGFGQVYRARHKDWADVGIKILHRGDGAVEEALLQEANFMNMASSPCVLRVYGLYQGCPPGMGTCMGIVMELMERGSLQSLQTALTGPPPWPLVFRLAKQVALGMNFLHTMEPPLLHQDLKPNNVLLDDSLNAKLTDFGLSRVSTSAFRSGTKGHGEEGGTCAYMPPEAFQLSYKPVRSYDIYSYGILLWSIVTGEEPYSGAKNTLVALLIPKGDRPDAKKIDQGKTDGLGELANLMERCWDNEPSKRPRFGECFQVTERLFSKHSEGIHDAVLEVLSKLQPSSTRVPSSVLTQPSATQSEDVGSSKQPSSTPVPSSVLTQPPATQSEDAVGSSKQDSVDTVTVELSDADKAKFVDAHRGDLIQNISMAMAIVDSLGRFVHSEAYSMMEAKETEQDKIRLLYTKTLRPGGVKAKAAFYNALREHQPDLLERFGG